MANYTDKPLSFQQQIALLKSNGLSFADESKALHTLQQISYFRLKSYLMPLMSDKELHTFKNGATFEQAYTLYKFDSRLRKLIAGELEKIEVSIRTQMAYTLSDEVDIYWFADAANFVSTPSTRDSLPVCNQSWTERTTTKSCFSNASMMMHFLRHG